MSNNKRMSDARKAELRALVADTPAAAGTLIQDGSKTLLRIDGRGVSAVLGADRAGSVFIHGMPTSIGGWCSTISVARSGASSSRAARSW